jgi:hypothetical protein
VLADVDGREDVIYHLGDLVGYAPWPNEIRAYLMRTSGKTAQHPSRAVYAFLRLVELKES